MPRKVTPHKVSRSFDEYRKALQARDDEICRLYAGYLADTATGWTLEKIGEKHGISKQRVWAIWKRYNPDPPT